MADINETMMLSGKLRINNPRCWLPKPNSQESELKIYFQFFFSPASVHLERKGQGEIVIFLFCLCTLDRKLGDWHGKNSYLLLVCCQLNHISTIASMNSRVFWPFSVPSSSLETVQETTCVTKDSLTREKETSILTGTFHVHLRERPGWINQRVAGIWT